MMLLPVSTSLQPFSPALRRISTEGMPHLPDWRWLLHRRDSPWYPSVRLYRQSKAQHWDDVFLAVANDLFAIGGADTQHLAG